jgi:hypothetical protein
MKCRAFDDPHLLDSYRCHRASTHKQRKIMYEQITQIVATPSTTSSHKRTARLVKAGAIVAVSAGLLGMMSGVASAQTSSQETTANAQVESGITMTGLTSSFTLTGTPGQTVTGIGAVTYNVETNNVAGYGVTVEANDPAMVPSIPGNTDVIPVSVLTVQETGGCAY